MADSYPTRWLFRYVPTLAKIPNVETLLILGIIPGLVVLSAIPMSIFGPINFFTWLFASIGLLRS